MSVMKGIVRYGVIAGLAGGAVTLIAGPERVCAIFTETRSAIQDKIDQNISDPVAMRAQLRQLAETYPGRIQEVRGDLAELQAHKGQLTRELAVAQRVTQLTRADLDTLQGLIARADQGMQEQQIKNASYSNDGPVIFQICFGKERLDVDQAMVRANEIEQTAQTSESAAADLERDLGYIGQQETRLSDLLAQLEQERDSFNAQLFALDRQVDAIARNERMIDMMQKRQETIDRQSRYRADSLDQLQGKFAEIRARQEAQLESLGKGATSQSYESRAKYELDVRGRASSSTLPQLKQTVIIKPKVVEVKPEAPEPAPQPASPISMNSR